MLNQSILALALVAGVLHAQDDPRRPPSPIHFFVGASIPTSDRTYNAGPLLGAASDVRSRASLLGARFEVSYASFNHGVVTRPIATVSTGTALTVDRTSEIGANVNGVLWSPLVTGTLLRPYVDAGASYAYLSDYATSGSVTYEHRAHHLGFNGGVGIDFPVAGFGGRIDGRYKQITVDGAQFKTILVTLGVRF